MKNMSKLLEKNNVEQTVIASWLLATSRGPLWQTLYFVGVCVVFRFTGGWSI